MYINRKIDQELLRWKTSKKHKPLLVRGARQVGKTHTIREFARTFDSFIEINFEESEHYRDIFNGSLDPAILCENISVMFMTSIVPGKTLLFFDEIQSCKNAIASLRFFYEKLPELHVIAAGSLLEFALQEIPTFGVGRIRSLFMYPISFTEFLEGSGHVRLLKMLRTAGPEKPLQNSIHEMLLNLWRKFTILGGMPEVISSYLEGADLVECQHLLDDLILSIKTDFAKYRHKSPVGLLSEVFQAVCTQTGHKFMYSKASPGTNHAQIKEALYLLITAGLVIPVVHSPANNLPLGSGANHQKQKMLILDTGIFQRILQLDIASILLPADLSVINNGSLAELSVALELVKSSSCYQPAELFYWHREAKSSNAEVDFIISREGSIIPIEVKSGLKGSMQSLNLFLKEKKHPRGIRISSENFSSYGNIEVYPLYAVENLKEAGH